LLSDLVNETKVREVVKLAFIAYLFFFSSYNKKHSQLKKRVTNDHAKGDGEEFFSSSHAAIRSAKQDDIYGASNIVLSCPGS
jgi:hypothetical protein